MTKTILSITQKSLFFLLKNPRYLFLGMVFTIGNWFPIPIQWENQDPMNPSIAEIPFIKGLFSHFTSLSDTLLFIFLTVFFFWIGKIILLSLLYLSVYSKQKKGGEMPILKIVGVALVTLPAIIVLHILLSLSLLVLFFFLGLPVASLLSAGSLYTGGFLGALAIVIFISVSITAFGIFLFSHFFILFSRLSLKNSLDTSARLYQRKGKVSVFFLLFFLIIFLLLQTLIALLPGFYFSEDSLVPLYAQLPVLVNIIGFIISFFLLALYFTLLPTASVLFFLHIAKQPPQKKSAANVVDPALAPLFRKGSETLRGVEED